MFVTVLLLIGSAMVVYLACEAFVNGVEWVGRGLKVSQTATGSILAAFGTALPESVVTLAATAFGRHAAQKQIGVGAALGGPLALSTLAYAVVGLALLAAGRKLGRGRNPVVQVDGRRLSRDQAWFLIIFACKIALGAAAFAHKAWLGWAFLAAYGLYAWVELRGDAGEDEAAPEALMIRPKAAAPPLAWSLAQTLAALAVTFFASQVFVGRLAPAARALGLSPAMAALLISPIATELPEAMNALIWVRQGRERLALANISGSMMIQATVPTAFCLFFTPWRLDRGLLIAAGVTAAAVAILFALFRSGRVGALKLANIGWLYAAFAVLILAWG
jgi:cation:H+ antiporter